MGLFEVLATRILTVLVTCSFVVNPVVSLSDEVSNGTQTTVLSRQTDGAITDWLTALIPLNQTVYTDRTGDAGISGIAETKPEVVTMKVDAAQVERQAVASTPIPMAAVTEEPTVAPTPVSTVVVTAKPAAAPTPEATAAATVAPTPVPTAIVTEKPTAVSTSEVTAVVTVAPTPVPTAVVTAKPTAVSTPEATAVVTVAPTAVATEKPTAAPTPVPTATPKPKPTPMNGYDHTTSIYDNDNETLLRVEYYDSNNKLTHYSVVSDFDSGTGSYTEKIYTYDWDTETETLQRTDTYVNGELEDTQ